MSDRPAKAASIRFFPRASNGPGPSLQICLLSFEFLGFWHNGGIATVSTGLAELLAAAGYRVTIAYTRADMLEPAAFDEAARRYRSQGIEVVGLRRSEGPPVAGPLAGFTGWERLAAYDFLSRRRFDIVHASEHLGEVAYCLAAKRMGLAFSNTQFWIGCHGPSQWVISANDDVVRDEFWLHADAAERFCVRHADLVWAPSQYLLDWMGENGFDLPPTRTYRQTYYIPDDLAGIAADPSDAAVDEIVLFGRLETRKGVKLFLAALRRLGDRLNGIKVTFMGRVGQIDGRAADAVIAEEMQGLGVEWRIAASMDRREAYTHVTRPGRLVVLASPVDNSPCAVYELLEVGARFIACRGGGIPELIDPRNHDEILFDYTVESLSERLTDVLSRGVARPAAAVDRTAAAAAWLAAHAELGRPAPVETASPSARGKPAVTAIVLHDGDPKALDHTLAALERCRGEVAEIAVAHSDRRSGSAPVLPSPIGRIDLDAASPRAILERLRDAGRPVLVLRAGAYVEEAGIARMRDGVTAVDAVVPIATTAPGGRPHLRPHLAGAASWGLLHGTAWAAGMFSPAALAGLAGRATSLPRANLMVWFDVAASCGLAVLPLAEPLIDAQHVEDGANFRPDERARVNVWAKAAQPDFRLLLEAAYGTFGNAAAPGPAGPLRIDEGAGGLDEYRALLSSRSYRVGARLASWLGLRSDLGEPKTTEEARAATANLLRSPAWDMGAPVRVLSRLLGRRS